MSMTIQVFPISDQDIDGAVTVIQEAFKDDPYAHWIYGTNRSESDLLRNRHSLYLRCKWGQRNALFHVAKDVSSTTPDEVVGVAMWMLPKSIDRMPTWREWGDEWWLWWRQGLMNLWFGRGGLNVKRYYIWKENQAKAQSKLWTDSSGYYFLNIIVVKPELQGKGIGRALFTEVTQRADREGRRCYLESSRDVPNTKIYEAIGFKTVMEMNCLDEKFGCDLFCMVREPVDGLSK